jgi:hypothetical protein
MGQPHKPYEGPQPHEVLSKIAEDIIQYVDWYCEHGLYLPPEYAKDPGAWAQLLRDIQASMKLLRVNPSPKNEPDKELLYDGIEKYYQYSRHLFRP